jgi:hypothetical protein
MQQLCSRALLHHHQHHHLYHQILEEKTPRAFQPKYQMSNTEGRDGRINSPFNASLQ